MKEREKGRSGRREDRRHRYLERTIHVQPHLSVWREHSQLWSLEELAAWNLDYFTAPRWHVSISTETPWAFQCLAGDSPKRASYVRATACPKLSQDTRSGM